jgi:type IV secretory pathway VirB4 component
MDFNFFPNVRKGDDAFVGVICGSKGSGKTTLLLDMLKSIWRNVYDLIVIVSPTFSFQSLSEEIDGRGVIIFSEFRPCIIQQIEELQKDKIYDKKEIEERLRHPELLTFRDPKSAPADHSSFDFW